MPTSSVASCALPPPPLGRANPDFSPDKLISPLSLLSADFQFHVCKP
jgi:hypothetical protein